MAAEIATVSRTGKTAAAVAFSSRVWYTGQKHAMGAMTMLQDLAFGRLDNHYEDLCPDKKDWVFCICGGAIMVRRDEYDALTVPTWEQVEAWSTDWEQWEERRVRYVFTLQGVRCFLWMGQAGEGGEEGYTYEPANSLRHLTSKHICFAAMTAWHLFCWYRDSRFCGRCGTKTVHDDKERMMRCPACGNMIFPRINPAVIIALTDGDRLMLSRYANRNFTRYGLLAGFLEIGETCEECVAREVMEEVGLKVKNIRYYKSQPWGVAGNVSIGYFCQLDGDDRVTLDENELASAEWFDRSSLPAKDDGISLTREMIRVFEEGNEPK